MFPRLKIKRYSYAEEVEEIIEKSREIRAELRALTKASEERRRLMRLEREAARNSE